MGSSRIARTAPQRDPAAVLVQVHLELAVQGLVHVDEHVRIVEGAHFRHLGHGDGVTAGAAVRVELLHWRVKELRLERRLGVRMRLLHRGRQAHARRG